MSGCARLPAASRQLASKWDINFELQEVRWGGVVLKKGAWAMVDPTSGEPLYNAGDAQQPSGIPGVKQTPSLLWFVRIKRVLAIAGPLTGGSSDWEVVLEVGWHRSPMGGAYSADLQAPLVQERESVERTAIHRFLPIKYILPLECVMRTFSRDVLIALRRTWQPLSVVGAQPPWPRMSFYTI